MSKLPIVFTEEERKILRTVLEFEWVKRDIGLASRDEVRQKPIYESAIKKLLNLVKIAKEQGLVQYE